MTVYHTQNNDGVSPVETQNFASPEEKLRQRQACIHLVLLLRLARETQDFASLFWIANA